MNEHSYGNGAHHELSEKTKAFLDRLPNDSDEETTAVQAISFLRETLDFDLGTYNQVLVDGLGQNPVPLDLNDISVSIVDTFCEPPLEEGTPRHDVCENLKNELRNHPSLLWHILNRFETYQATSIGMAQPLRLFKQTDLFRRSLRSVNCEDQASIVLFKQSVLKSVPDPRTVSEMFQSRDIATIITINRKGSKYRKAEFTQEELRKLEIVSKIIGNRLKNRFRAFVDNIPFNPDYLINIGAGSFHVKVRSENFEYVTKPASSELNFIELNFPDIEHQDGRLPTILVNWLRKIQNGRPKTLGFAYPFFSSQKVKQITFERFYEYTMHQTLNPLGDVVTRAFVPSDSSMTILTFGMVNPHHYKVADKNEYNLRKRQLEVAALACLKIPQQQSAMILNIAFSTFKIHLSNARRKAKIAPKDPSVELLKIPAVRRLANLISHCLDTSPHNLDKLLT